METLLGSAPPVWTGVPPTGFGWYQTAVPIGTHPVGPAGVAGGSSLQVGPAASFQTPTGDYTHAILTGNDVGVASSFVSTPYGALGVSVPAAALLATVALRRGQPQGPASESRSSCTMRSTCWPERATSRFGARAGARRSRAACRTSVSSVTSAKLHGRSPASSMFRTI